ncbi:hypothetical protein [Anoxybacillus flavithermus]|nr:hypothetical protein [Anoxybacillus flavithermus]MBE2941170.1 hypothetical protein [Anoxybacillus flavithermus]MBE2942430.1 hypothetical protein [Anoxybacillus flavithermus]MBE2950666.1 hypothetical protein [Anoxybacillus flavithermus]MBE2953430.1 hypothetical protein [Anoxybacillus flavithermus]MBE2959398.1 hypothetical protein [Anoxybacillus flavithermus]
MQIPPIRSHPLTVPRVTNIQRATNEKKQETSQKKKRPQDRSLKKR